MKYYRIFTMVLTIAIIIVLKTTTVDEVIREKWSDYSHDGLIKKVEMITPENRAVISNDSNLRNYGIVLETDEYNYIVFDGLHLEKTDKELKTVDVLISKSGGYSMGNLQLMDKWLFYSSDGLYRMNLETKDIDHLYSKNVMDFYLTEYNIYFIDYKRGMNLFRMGLNGENLEKIYDSVVYEMWYTGEGFSAIVVNNAIKQLVDIDYDGNVDVVIDSFRASRVQQVDDYLYFKEQDTDYLMKMNLDTLSKEVIIDEPIHHFAYDNGDIFYSLKVGTGKLYDGLGIYRLTKEGETILLDDETLLSTGNLSILGEYIFYESDYKKDPFKNVIVKKDGSERVTIDRKRD